MIQLFFHPFCLIVLTISYFRSITTHRRSSLKAQLAYSGEFAFEVELKLGEFTRAESFNDTKTLIWGVLNFIEQFAWLNFDFNIAQAK